MALNFFSGNPISVPSSYATSTADLAAMRGAGSQLATATQIKAYQAAVASAAQATYATHTNTLYPQLGPQPGLSAGLAGLAGIGNAVTLTDQMDESALKKMMAKKAARSLEDVMAEEIQRLKS